MRISRMVAFVGGLSTVAVGALLLALPVGGQSSPPAEPSDAWPLEDIPGFGVSEEGVVRDDAIAYWEAWKRDVAVEACMHGHGFPWAAEALYPADAVIRVAELVGIDTEAASPSRDEAPFQRNAEYVAGLSDESRNQYYLALYGETADDIDYANRNHGEVPQGRVGETFASGGCRGAAAALEPSIWDLPRALAPQLDEFRAAERESDEFRAQQDLYARCTGEHGLSGASGPADVEKYMAGPDGQDAALVEKVIAVTTNCQAIWEAASRQVRARAGAALLEAEPQLLEEQRERYAGVVDRMRADSEFLGFLSESAARIMAEIRSQ